MENSWFRKEMIYKLGHIYANLLGGKRTFRAQKCLPSIILSVDRDIMD